MDRTRFVERFLVTPVGEAPPEPAEYDEARGLSVASDGRAFIDTGAALATRSITEAEGESSDDDEDAAYRGVNVAASHRMLTTRTATFVDTEGRDTDEDRLAALPLHTDTRVAGERPDASPWAHTETAAPGEPRDYDPVAYLVTVTKAAGESND